MIKLKDILLEAKQVGIIYHYTSLHRAEQILDRNYMLADRDGYEKDNMKSVSFTRDKYFAGEFRSAIPTQCRLVFDGTKLSEKYKIEPFQYTGTNSVKFGDDDLSSPVGDEQEERLYTKSMQVPNIKNYIIRLELPKTIDNALELLSRASQITHRSVDDDVEKEINNALLKAVNLKKFKLLAKKQHNTDDILRLAPWLYYDDVYHKNKLPAAMREIETILTKYYGIPTTFTMESKGDFFNAEYIGN